MRVMVKPVGESPFFKEIADRDSLADMQAIVGGYIERIDVAAWFPSMEGARKIDCYCDEEGKLKHQWSANINFFLGEGKHAREDAAVGTVFFCSHDGEGDSLPISDEQAKAVCNHLGWKVPVTT
jgi:hypothetical protein